MKCPKLLACVAGLLLSTFTTAAFAAPRQATGAFEVVGARIYDPAGREFIAKGANVSGVNWVWPRSTVADEKWIVDQWKFNFLRVNCRLEKGPWSDNDDLDKIVETFTRRKVVVMPEMHDYSGGAYPETAKEPGKPTLADLVAWWKTTAARYKNNPYVWFNVMNEPGYLENVDKTPWYSLHKTVVDAIRSTGAKNIIVCDGHGFANEADETGTGKVRNNKSAILTYGPRLLADDPVHRIVYAFHIYGGWNFGDEKMADYVDRVQAKNLALLAGEYAQQPQYDFTAAAQTLFNVCVPRGVGRVVWHWFPGDGNSLTAAEKKDGNESGWAIDRTDGTRPTNLSWLGERIWNDNHDLPPPEAGLGFPLSKARWTVTASHFWDEKSKENKPTGRFVPALAADNDPASYWDSGNGDAPDRYLQIDLGEKQTFHQIVLDPRKDFLNFAPAYKIYVTSDPAVAAGPTSGWGAPVAQGVNKQTVLRITFPVQNARYIRAALPGAPGGKSLFIHEIDFYTPGAKRLTRAATTGEPGRDLLWVGQVKAPTTGLFRFAAPRDPLAQIRVNGYTVNGNRPVTLVAGQNYDVAVRPMTLRVNGLASPPALTWTYAGQPKFVPVSSHLLHGRLGGRHEGGTLLPRQGWTATASGNGGDKPANALDGDPFTRWSSGAEQAPGQFLQLDLGRAQIIEKVVLEVGKFGGDFARGYELFVSGDGENWDAAPVASGTGGPVTTIAFSPRVARFVKVVTTKSAPGAWFSVAEVNVFGPDDTRVPVLSFAPAR